MRVSRVWPCSPYIGMGQGLTFKAARVRDMGCQGWRLRMLELGVSVQGF